MGGQERKDRKTWKSRSEGKVVGFTSAFLFPIRKREAVTQGGTMEPGGYTTWRGGELREPVSSKFRKTSETAGAFQIHSRKTRRHERDPRIPNV